MSHDAFPAGILHSLRIRISMFLVFIAGLLLPAAMRAQAVFTGPVTTVSGGYNQPTGVGVDVYGNVYVIVLGGNQQLKEALQTDGTYVESTVLAPTGGFSFPWGVAVDGSGDLFIPNSLSNTVVKMTPSDPFNPATSVTLTLDAGVGPAGIAVDSAGNLYVSSPNLNSVYKETPTGGGVYTKSTIASGLGDGGPYGVAVDSLGKVYIADTGNNQILIETPAGGGTYTQTTVGTGLLTPAGCRFAEPCPS